jgi:hypothetical protein
MLQKQSALNHAGELSLSEANGIVSQADSEPVDSEWNPKANYARRVRVGDYIFLVKVLHTIAI